MKAQNEYYSLKFTKENAENKYKINCLLKQVEKDVESKSHRLVSQHYYLWYTQLQPLSSHPSNSNNLIEFSLSSISFVSNSSPFFNPFMYSLFLCLNTKSTVFWKYFPVYLPISDIFFFLLFEFIYETDFPLLPSLFFALSNSLSMMLLLMSVVMRAYCSYYFIYWYEGGWFFCLEGFLREGRAFLCLIILEK